MLIMPVTPLSSSCSTQPLRAGYHANHLLPICRFSFSQVRHPRRPTFSYPPHVVLKPLARHPRATAPLKRRMLIRYEERVLAQPHPRVLHGAEHRLELRIPQAASRGALGGAVDPPTAGVDDAHEAHPCVGLEAVDGEAVVHGVEEADVTREADVGGGVLAGAEFEDVDRGGQEEGELEGCADRGECVGSWVVGWEDGDVKGVVLC